jgi:hypothetical protein
MTPEYKNKIEAYINLHCIATVAFPLKIITEAEQMLADAWTDRTALLQRIEELKEITDELMETMDWTGTGSTDSGRIERERYEKRIAALALPSPQPAEKVTITGHAGLCGCNSPMCPECSGFQQPAKEKVCVWTPNDGHKAWHNTSCGMITPFDPIRKKVCHRCHLPIEVAKESKDEA